MSKFNLTDAAKAILSEDSRSSFEANIKSKMAQRGGEKAPHGEVGINKLPTSTVAGQQDVGEIGQSPEKEDDHNPDYTKGTPTATPPGATPPVGSEKDGVGITTLKGQPQQTMGRSDLTHPTQASATDYEAIRDRIAGKLAPQMMPTNAGGVGVQSYGEETEMDDEMIEEKMMHDKKKMMHDKMKDKMKEDIEALVSGENLSEEFVTKATTIFESAVLTRVDTIVEEVEADLMEQFEVALEQVKEDLATKVDDYLNYMVEEWIKDNEIAIEKGLRSEIVEDFISGLKTLFEEHYIDVPTEKVDVVEELATKVEELEESLNEAILVSVELNKELNEAKKIEAIHAVCEGLTQTQVEKLKSLAEGVDFTTVEEFATKLETLKESYFKGDVKVADKSALDDEVEIEEDKKVVNTDPLMEAYVKTISKTLVK